MAEFPCWCAKALKGKGVFDAEHCSQGEKINNVPSLQIENKNEKLWKQQGSSPPPVEIREEGSSQPQQQQHHHNQSYLQTQRRG